MLTEPTQFAEALLQPDTTQMTTILEHAKLTASISDYPNHPESLAEYARITNYPRTTMALAVQKTSKKMLLIRDFLTDRGMDNYSLPPYRPQAGRQRGSLRQLAQAAGCSPASRSFRRVLHLGLRPLHFPPDLAGFNLAAGVAEARLEKLRSWLM